MSGMEFSAAGWGETGNTGAKGVGFGVEWLQVD